MLNVIWLTILSPIIGVLVNGLFDARLDKKVSGFIGCASVAVSLVVAVGAFLQLLAIPPEQQVITVPLFDWISIGTLRVPAELRVDPLSVVMLLIVTGVGFLIHVYSLGYMSADPRFARFFTYLNLFMGAMLLLVLGNNYLVTFVGWEGVGLCSYLLIGFWFDRPSAVEAGKKAFIVNRIGDFGFLLGMALIFRHFQTLDFQPVFDAAASKEHVLVLGGIPLLTLATLCLFVGATGKSAQIPLYVWLPDAMEGPTPVSALIHAATMVTAGVYMVARCHVLFLHAPLTMGVVAVVGAFTAILAASIALVQNDIKRVLAYSTVSQLGYMFLGCGVGAFAAGVFHVFTHAFFKALLFLGSGSVIHAMEHGIHAAHNAGHSPLTTHHLSEIDPQDMRNMGGLKDFMPQTSKTFIIGALALAGAPLLSGFWSKDEILFNTFTTSIVPMSKLLYVIGLVTALMTAFYMTRQCLKIFAGRPRFDERAVHPHESPLVMTLPLWILAAGSVFAGFVGLPGRGNLWERFLKPVFESHASEEAMAAFHRSHSLSWLVPLMCAAFAVAAIGYFWGRAVYKDPDQEPLQRLPLYNRLLNKWGVDEFYNATIVAPGYLLSDLCARFDLKIIDGFVNSVAGAMAQGARSLRGLQTSYVRNYALVMVFGGVLLVTYLAYFAMR